MTRKKKLSLRKLFWLFGGLGFFFILLACPRPQTMPPEAQKLVAIVGLMATWWIGEAVPLAATAISPLILYPFLGIMSIEDAAPHYSNHLIFLFLGGFMIAIAIERWNLHRRVALWIIDKIGSNPERIVLGFMLASAFLSMWISNTATTMMLLPVGMVVVNQIAEQASLQGHQGKGVKRAIQEGYGGILMLGLAYAASIGGMGTLIGTPPNIIFAGFYKKSFPDLPEISFLQWMLMALPLVITLIPLVWFYLCRIVCPFPLKTMELEQNAGDMVRLELEKMGRMGRVEKFLALVFIMTGLLWVFRKPIALGVLTIPGWSSLFPQPNLIYDSTVAIAMGLLLMVFPLGMREPLIHKGRRYRFVLDWETVRRGVPWEILFLFGGGFALAAGFKKTGLDMWLGSYLAGWATLPMWIAIPSMCLGLTFLSEFTSNTATATMVLPIIAATAISAGINPLLIMFPATLALSMVFMMPVATPPNAIVMGSKWVTIPRMVRAGIRLDLLGMVLITLLTATWIKYVFT